MEADKSQREGASRQAFVSIALLNRCPVTPKHRKRLITEVRSSVAPTALSESQVREDDVCTWKTSLRRL